MTGPASNLRKESARIPEQAHALAVPVASESWLLVERYGRADAEALMQAAVTDKRTGSLTLHFGQGTITTVEWKQRAKKQ